MGMTQQLLRAMRADDMLPVVATTGALLRTLGHLVARLRAYRLYPVALWRLSMRLNREAWAEAGM